MNVFFFSESDRSRAIASLLDRIFLRQTESLQICKLQTRSVRLLRLCSDRNVRRN